MSRHVMTIDGFAPQSKALRKHFDVQFAEPRVAAGKRFVWDYWHIPGQYTALRTPAYAYFPKAVYQAWHQRLVWWGRRTLGCHDISPPWLSCYVEGCEQRLHADVPHGPFAFVYSLTNWSKRTFRGGETMVMRPQMMSLWAQPGGLDVEEAQLFTEVPAQFGRLTVFDPRLPHGVRRVTGTQDPREGRLVMHGWFVQPRPFVEGPLGLGQVAPVIDAVSHAVAPFLKAGLPLVGLWSYLLQIGPNGQVRSLKALADTSHSGDLKLTSALRSAVERTLRAHTFGRSSGRSQLTLPLLFES
jgi:hypothetical protein